MSSALLALAARYLELGLPAAAWGAFARAEAAGDPEGAAAAGLARAALGVGAPAPARAAATRAVGRSASAAHRLLLGRALRLGGALAAARAELDAASTATDATADQRAEALVALADAARADGDPAGAERALGAASLAGAGDGDVLADLAAAASELGCARSLRLALEARLAGATGLEAAALGLARCALLRAAQAQDQPGIPDGEIERGLQRALMAAPGHPAIRLALASHLMRRRDRDRRARARAVALLGELARELDPDGVPAPLRRPAGGRRATLRYQEARPTPTAARVYLLLGGLYDDEPASAALAVACYSRGLELGPQAPAAVNNLGVLALARADARAAVDLFVSASAAGYDLAARNLGVALLTERGRAPEALVGDFARLFAAVGEDGAPAAAARLASAFAEAARAEVFAGLYTRGHQIKNLLGVVAARVRGLRVEVDPARAGRVEELGGQLRGLYDEWAAYLRTMRDEPPRREAVAPGALVLEAVAAAGASPGRDVAVRSGGGVAELRGDRRALREALVNLIRNALEAQPPGIGPVEIEVRDDAAHPRDGGRVVIGVRDRGPGVARADLRRIFAPGYTTKPSGSGFGLAIAERVIAAHGGRIEVESEPGRGACFSVHLPGDAAGVPPRRASPAPAPLAGAAAVHAAEFEDPGDAGAGGGR